MIFVTVGGQKGFDRLVKSVDEWAGEHPAESVFAQIGESEYTPQHIDWVDFLAPAEFRARAEEATAIVAHAGIGVILTSIDLDTPILIMPRKASLGEHRNEHQRATANRLKEMINIPVADDEFELVSRLDSIESLARPSAAKSTRGDLVAAIRSYMDKD